MAAAILDFKKCHWTKFCTPSGNCCLRPLWTHINRQKKSVQKFHLKCYSANIPPDYASGGCDQFETSPEANDQELQTAFCERRYTYRLKTNYRIDTYFFLLCSFLSSAWLVWLSANRTCIVDGMSRTCDFDFHEVRSWIMYSDWLAIADFIYQLTLQCDWWEL